MDTIELLARFAYKPSQLNLCGPQDANLKLYRYLTKRDNLDEVKILIPGFQTMYPYLHLISEKMQMGILDYSVAEAYWLGNTLLDRFTARDMEKFAISKGLPRNIKLREGVVPHHSFNVLYLNKGVPIENVNKCLVSYGKVKEIYINELVVTQKPLVYHNKEYGIGESIEKKVSFDRKLLPNLNLGDIIAIHWDFAVMKLSREQLYNLEKYTLRNIAAVNSERR